MNAVEVAEWIEPLLRMFIIFTTNSDGTDVAYDKISSRINSTTCPRKKNRNQLYNLIMYK